MIEKSYLHTSGSRKFSPSKRRKNRDKFSIEDTPERPPRITYKKKYMKITSVERKIDDAYLLDTSGQINDQPKYSIQSMRFQSPLKKDLVRARVVNSQRLFPSTCKILDEFFLKYPQLKIYQGFLNSLKHIMIDRGFRISILTTTQLYEIVEDILDARSRLHQGQAHKKYRVESEAEGSLLIFAKEYFDELYLENTRKSEYVNRSY